MTAATTSENKKKGFFSVRFKSKFSEDMKLFITNIVFQLFCLPVFAGILIWETHLQNNQIFDRTDSIPFAIIAVIALFLSIGMGFVVPMVNFRYLYNKSIVDMNYSLPLNNRQRFFADYSSGLITYVVPFLIGGIVALIVLLIGSCCVEMDYVMDYIYDMVRIFFIMIIGLILLYTISVFAITFAGSTFEALFSIAAVNVMIPLFIYITWGNIVSAAHFGLTESSVTKNYTFFTTSPIGVLGFFITYLDDYYMPHSYISSGAVYDLTEYTFMDSMYFNFIIRSLIFIAVIIAITFLLYKHRKAEDVSKPYVYKAFYYIIMSAAVYSIVTIMKMTAIKSGLIAALIISGIIWFVMEVIRRRGFKRFWTAIISFAAASAAVIGIIKVIELTDGLGRAKYIPSSLLVSDIEIEIWGYDMADNAVILHDKKIIDDAIRLNREIIDRHFEPDKYSYVLSDYRLSDDDRLYSETKKKNYDLDIADIRMIYYTKGGSAIVRQYKVPSEMLTDISCDIYTDKEFAENKTKEIYYNSLRREGDPIDYIDESHADYCNFEFRDKLDVSKSIELSVEEGKELAEAIRRDYTAMTAEEFKNAEFYSYIGDIIINSACHESLRFMDEHNIAYKKTGSELLDEIDTYSSPVTVSPAREYVFPLMYFKNYNYTNDFSYNEPSDYDNYTNECIKLDSVFNLRLYRGRSYIHYGKKKHFEFANTDAVETLLEAATPVVTGEKVLAEVQIGSITLFITDRTGNDVMIEKARDSIKIVDNKTGEEYDPDLYYEQSYSK
ncbi:ABC transporter permease [Ruminococcus flavefaciens]|uniref:ABC transporter permease n=1 Tax=Ruminococcus flavefaciens TaxID=1265 RepID=UPI000491A0D5|nr:ABC transporter permease [Ruminococcus flavefaciens]